MTFICRPASVDIWYIHWIFIQKKTSEKKLDVNARYPRRARWDFRGVLDDKLFLYLESDMNKHLKNWGNYEVLWIKFGGFIVTIVFLYGRFLVLRCFCLQFYVECFAYALATLVFSIFLCLSKYPSLYCIPFLFLVYYFPGFVILPTLPPQLQSPVFVCAIFAYPSFVDPPCGLSIPQCGSDDSYFLQINPKFLFYFLHSVLMLFKNKPSTSSYRRSSCPAAMGCSPLYFMNFTSTQYWERLILYLLYPILGPCSSSKFIACCITCHRNGTGSFP